jgi:hypothetical protein
MFVTFVARVGIPSAPTFKQGILTEWDGRISTVNLLVLTSSNQLILIMIFCSFYNQAIVMRRSTVQKSPFL